MAVGGEMYMYRGGGTELSGKPGGLESGTPRAEHKNRLVVPKVPPTTSSSVTCLLARVPGQVSLSNTGLNTIQQFPPGAAGGWGSLGRWPLRPPSSFAWGQDRIRPDAREDGWNDCPG